jgi:glycine/D-amino acid oxidase-like deaminating enzyme
MDAQAPSPTLRADYDPRYDPLVDPHPGQGRHYAPTYWVATAGTPPADDGPIQGDVDADVVIVGSGFTGLAAALFLAREHGIRATVLEANQVVWGCTSRNGGQGQNASGRLTRSQWIERWGKATALRMDAEIRAGFETFRGLVAELPDCEAQHGGHLYIAHRDRRMQALRREAEVLRSVYGYRPELLTVDEVHRQYLADQDCRGALLEHEGIGVHPLKLAFGYLRLARQAGARVHPASPVLDCRTSAGVHHLRTPGGTVRARAVGFATGGYTSQGLHASLRWKIMPVLSNSLVTRPLSESERAAAGLHRTTFATDTRTLRHYYRLLPDHRLQIGSRSAITGADAPNPRHQQRLEQALHRKFPALRGVELAYSWWGWVDVSHDMMPRIAQPDARQRIFYALGYGGNGVSFSAHAGRRLAQRLAGATGAEAFGLPIYDGALMDPRVLGRWSSPLFGPFRRLGQRALYRWYALSDEWP